MINPNVETYGTLNRMTSKNLTVSPVTLSRVEAGKPVTPSPTEVDKTALEAAVKKLNEQVAPTLQSIEFSLDQSSNRLVVKVVDTASNTVLRQIPNEEVLAFSKTLDRLQGLVVRQIA
jgi:flagellar protein FlaG